MLPRITDALHKCKSLAGWTVRQVVSREAQLYGVPATLESRRLVEEERFIVNTLMETQAPDGSAACGAGEITILPGDDIDAAIEVAIQTAGLTHNPPYALPEPAELPEVALADPLVREDPAKVAEDLMVRLYAVSIPSSRVRMTAAECYVQEETTRLVNSRGIDAVQVATRIDIEWVLIARKGDEESESFVFLTRRRAADLDLDKVMVEQARYAEDLLEAGPAPEYQGPVVLQDGTLDVFFMANEIGGGPLQVLGSAHAKYNEHSTWEVGKSIFPKEPSGDPFRLWATRLLPYGTHAARFDEEGIPAQRVELIRDGKLKTFVAGQRHAQYLGIPATGPFGDVEVAPGPTPAAELLTGRYVQVVTFSWFNPDQIRGEFATEIRLGYLVEDGVRKPFRGGQLVGNFLEALADARWSKETGFYGSYQGPTTARLAHLRVSGGESG